MFSILRMLRRLHRRIQNRYIRRVMITIGIVMVCIMINSGTFYYFEKQVQDVSIWDSFWLSFTTITTVGYGDISAKTIQGRLATMILLYFIGLASFPYLVTQVVDLTVEGANERRRGFSDLRDSLGKHIIVVNFPDELTVGAIIDQLSSDPLCAEREIVIIDDTLQELPFRREKVHFIHGSSIQMDTLQRANVKEAYVALVLSSISDRRSADALTAATVSMIEQLNPSIRVIAECSSVEHLTLFEPLRCSAVIPTQNIGAKLLAQEIRDRGLAPAISELLTQAEGSELYSEPIEEIISLRPMTVNNLQSFLVELKIQLVLVGIIRDNQPWINPTADLELQGTDRLILISHSRQDWESIYSQIKHAIQNE